MDRAYEVTEMSETWNIEADLDGVLDRIRPELSELDGRTLFVTGATGFIGKWLLEMLRRAHGRGIRVQTHILTRSPARFATNAPHLAGHKDFHFHAGEITSFDLSGLNPEFIVHAATDASAKLNQEDPLKMFDTAVLGTRNLLTRAAKWQSERALFLSSGAVYGRQPPEVPLISESWRGAPDCLDPVNTYAESKRCAELLCAIAARESDMNISIARIFAVLGPGLELDCHFAAGNFLSDAIAGREVTVNGNGLAVRSYLYPTDLLVMLVKLLVRGASGKAYNVGSEEAVTIRELAERISAIVGNGATRVLGSVDAGWNPGRYVPAVGVIRDEFGIEPIVNLDRAIRNTAFSYGWRNRGENHLGTAQ
jgi:nucleoside-diphosphate-sugar epimerase